MDVVLCDCGACIFYLLVLFSVNTPHIEYLSGGENVHSCWSQDAYSRLEVSGWLRQWSLRTLFSWEDYFNQTVYLTKCPRFLIWGNVKAVKANGGWSVCALSTPCCTVIPKFILFSLHCSQLTNPLLSQPYIVRHNWSSVSPIRGRGALESHPCYVSLHFSLDNSFASG